MPTLSVGTWTKICFNLLKWLVTCFDCEVLNEHDSRDTQNSVSDEQWTSYEEVQQWWERQWNNGVCSPVNNGSKWVTQTTDVQWEWLTDHNPHNWSPSCWEEGDVNRQRNSTDVWSSLWLTWEVHWEWHDEQWNTHSPGTPDQHLLTVNLVHNLHGYPSNDNVEDTDSDVGNQGCTTPKPTSVKIVGA